jgi:predicted flap endonuclease-1-like 5' DNA nuclease
MSPDSEDISRWIQELISRSSREQIQVMQRLSNLVQRVSSGDMDQAQVREEYNRFIKNESSRYVEDLTRLGLSFQTALLELNRKYSDRFFDQVMGSSFQEVPAPNGKSTAPKEIEMHLSGACGEELVRSFVIENKRAEEETVTFLISEFTDAATTVAFRPPLQFQPARVLLHPGEERMVTLRLPLLVELFKPGETYLATVIARGHNDVVLSMRVDVSQPSPKPEIGLAVRAGPVQVPLPQEEKAAPGTASPGDDLTQIKGIGASFAARLNAAGVRTYAELGALTARRLEKILGSAAYQRAKRERWREQAKEKRVKS